MHPPLVYPFWQDDAPPYSPNLCGSTTPWLLTDQTPATPIGPFNSKAAAPKCDAAEYQRLVAGPLGRILRDRRLS